MHVGAFLKTREIPSPQGPIPRPALCAARGKGPRRERSGCH